MIFNKATNLFYTLTKFNIFINIYKFKSFKRNIKFKKYNKGITLFIKNRKKYIVRKRKTSNISWYYYISKWSKYYLVYRQFYRFSQFYFLLKYTTVSPILNSLVKLKSIDLIHSRFNSSNISKSILWNKSLFYKINFLHVRDICGSNLQKFFYFNDSKEKLMPSLLVVRGNIYNYLDKNINTDRTTIFLLLDLVLRNILDAINLHRRFFLLLLLKNLSLY